MAKEKKKGFVLRALDTVEHVGNALPNPATIFLILTGVVIVLSAICAACGVSVTYDFLDNSKGEITQKTVAAVSLLAPDSIRHMVTTVVGNFTGFVGPSPITWICIHHHDRCRRSGRNRIYVCIAEEGGCFHSKGICDSCCGILRNYVQHRIFYRICSSGAIGRSFIYGIRPSSNRRSCSSLCRCIRRMECKPFDRNQ